MARHFKVEQLLEAKELEQLKDFARQPACTIDQCHQWMLERGYVIHRSAVGTWKASLVADDRFSASRETAEAVLSAARGGGLVSITDASLATLSELLFQQLSIAQCGETVKTGDLLKLALALRQTVKAKESLEDVRKVQVEALAEAEKKAKSGGSAQDVVATIKAALGLTAQEATK